MSLSPQPFDFTASMRSKALQAGRLLLAGVFAGAAAWNAIDYARLLPPSDNTRFSDLTSFQQQRLLDQCARSGAGHPNPSINDAWCRALMPSVNVAAVHGALEQQRRGLLPSALGLAFLALVVGLPAAPRGVKSLIYKDEPKK